MTNTKSTNKILYFVVIGIFMGIISSLTLSSDGIFRKIIRYQNNPSRETLIKNSLAELVFDQDGPKNNFLETCKTNQNKTVFKLISQP